MYKAVIKLTVGKKTYHPGETITGKLKQMDETFLLREGYIEKVEEAPAGKTKTAKNVPDAKE